MRIPYAACPLCDARDSVAVTVAEHAVELAAYRAAAPFDVVSMADVLEHMPFPKRALRDARQLLQPGGLLFLSMPNADAFVWQASTRAGTNPYWARSSTTITSGAGA